jgi:hypothetical protein
MGLVIAASLPFMAAQADVSQNTERLHVVDGRPVAAVVQELISRYRYVITYEDPKYAFAGDLQDVTAQVRKDLDQFPRGDAPRVIVPAEDSLTVYVPKASNISPAELAHLLQTTVQAQARNGQGGRFQVVRSGEIFHVIPSAARDRNGTWVPQTSILDVPISLRMRDRGRWETLQDICDAVSVAAHVKINYAGPVGGLSSLTANPKPYRLGAQHEKARDLLVRAFRMLNDPNSGTWISQKLTWLLFYDASDHVYALNIRTVDARPSTTTPNPGASVSNPK